jgi:hypothetical protein
MTGVTLLRRFRGGQLLIRCVGEHGEQLRRYPLQMIDKAPQRGAAIDIRPLHQALFHWAVITALQRNEIR